MTKIMSQGAICQGGQVAFVSLRRLAVFYKLRSERLLCTRAAADGNTTGRDGGTDVGDVRVKFPC